MSFRRHEVAVVVVACDETINSFRDKRVTFDRKHRTFSISVPSVPVPRTSLDAQDIKAMRFSFALSRYTQLPVRRLRVPKRVFQIRRLPQQPLGLQALCIVTCTPLVYNQGFATLRFRAIQSYREPVGHSKELVALYSKSQTWSFTPNVRATSDQIAFASRRLSGAM
jgi:hypothetical protein